MEDGTITYKQLRARPFDKPHKDGHFDWLQSHPEIDEIHLIGFDAPIEGRPTLRVTFKDGRDPIEQQGLSFSSAAAMFFFNNPEFRDAIPEACQ